VSTIKGVMLIFIFLCIFSVIKSFDRQVVVDVFKEMTSPDAQGKAQASGGTSRFSRFGFGSQLLQKTVGLVLKPRPGRQV